MHETKLQLKMFAIEVEDNYSLRYWLESNSSTMLSSFFVMPCCMCWKQQLMKVLEFQCYAKLDVVQCCVRLDVVHEALSTRYWTMERKWEHKYECVHNEHFHNLKLSCLFFGCVTYHKFLQGNVNLKFNVNATLTFNTISTCTCHVIIWW